MEIDLNENPDSQLLDGKMESSNQLWLLKEN